MAWIGTVGVAVYLQLTGDESRRRARRLGGLARRSRYDVTRPVSLWVSVAVVAVLFGWGAWQRRWIADDGLIVLRTVRNLLAGNGPVFNKGERVEANTSTVWTYLCHARRLDRRPGTARVRGAGARADAQRASASCWRCSAPAGCTRRGCAAAGAAAARRRAGLHRDPARARLRHLRARKRFGAGLSRPAVVDDGVLVAGLARARRRGRATRAGNATSRIFDGTLAFVAGCSVLVRPELALIGGLALVMMLVAARGWRRRLLIVVAGGLLPVAYQVFRMGYYGLLVPGTAIAKDASGSKWYAGLHST